MPIHSGTQETEMSQLSDSGAEDASTTSSINLVKMMWTHLKKKTTLYARVWIPAAKLLAWKKKQHMPCSDSLNVFKYFSVLQSMPCTPIKLGRKDLLTFSIS